MQQVVSVILFSSPGVCLWPVFRADFSTQFLVLSAAVCLFQQVVGVSVGSAHPGVHNWGLLFKVGLSELLIVSVSRIFKGSKC